MSGTPKNPHAREDEAARVVRAPMSEKLGREHGRASGREAAREPGHDDDRAQVKLYDEDTFDLEEDLTDSLYFDDLAAMEGPDA